MIDEDLIRESGIAKEGLKMLVHSGVLQQQLERLQERVLHGSDEEPNDELVQRIKLYRRDRSFIQTLLQLGEILQGEGEG